jgi:hypothetical protein
MGIVDNRSKQRVEIAGEIRVEIHDVCLNPALAFRQGHNDMSPPITSGCWR